MKNYKVGLIGCGGISVSHYNGFKQTGRAKIEYVWDIDEDAATRRAQEWDASVSSSAEELVESECEIIVISTPGFAHREYVEMAASRGKHILCEKPLALNMEDALAIKNAVEKNDITFIVSFNHRYTPAFVQLKEMQDKEVIGGTVSAWARRHAPASSERWRHIQKTGHWRSSMELSGGRINEFCSHDINWLLWILGKPKTVYGKALHVTEGFQLDDADYALIDCERGVGLLEVNRHAGVAHEENFGVMGHGGTVLVKDQKVLFTPMDEKTKEIPIAQNVVKKHEHFLNCIENNTKPKTNVDDAIDTLKVCLAFNRSAETNAVENVL